MLHTLRGKVLKMNNKKNVNIAFCFDVNYMYYMIVAAVSVLDNIEPDRKVFFHLLHQNLNDKLIDVIKEKLCRSNVDLFFYAETELGLPKINVGRYGMASLYRLVLDRVLPNELKKIIYLDCDLLVLGNIAELWDIDLKNSVAAAVVNLSDKPAKEIKEVKFLSSDYFNSGVLVINMDRWREEDVSNKVFKSVVKNNLIFNYLDQSSLNLVLHKHWLKLPVKWNMESDIYAYKNSKKEHRFHTADSINNALNSPGIIHFTGPKKPWHYYSFHPYKLYYKNLFNRVFGDIGFLYKDKTPAIVFKKMLKFNRNIKEKINRPNAF